MSSLVRERTHLLRVLIRLPYLYAGDFLDGWYEELPWRKHVSLGRRGEQVAARYLRRRGYLILARNYRAAGAEIDLVASEGQTLVFVEVKTRSGLLFGLPAEAVNDAKQARIRRAAEAYVLHRHVGEVPIRFDVVAMVGTGHNRRLELIRDAF
jgi:putative endonuclease